MPRPRAPFENLDSVETSRYPDALINCAPPDPKGDIAQNPVVVFEVLSDSTKAKDFNEKFDEYEATPAIRQYVLVFQDEIRVEVYRREGGDCSGSRLYKP